MGIAKRWQEARCAAAVAECGTGKTLISLGSVFTHADGRPFTALAMVPPQLVEKWARECFLTLPGIRVFMIDGVRNGVGSNGFTGVNEVRFRNGRVVREGLKTTLSDMRLAKTHRSARARWRLQVPSPSVFVISRERAKLGYFWRHAYTVAQSGPFQGNIVNGYRQASARGRGPVTPRRFQEGQAFGSRLTGRNEFSEGILQPALASRPGEDPPDGADGIHRPVRACDILHHLAMCLKRLSVEMSIRCSRGRPTGVP